MIEKNKFVFHNLWCPKMNRVPTHLFQDIFELSDNEHSAWLYADYHVMPRVLHREKDELFSSMCGFAERGELAECRVLKHLGLTASDLWNYSVLDDAGRGWTDKKDNRQMLEFLKEWRDPHAVLLCLETPFKCDRLTLNIIRLDDTLYQCVKDNNANMFKFLIDWRDYNPDGSVDQLILSDIRFNNNYALKHSAKTCDLVFLRLLKEYQDSYGMGLTLNDIDKSHAVVVAIELGQLKVLQFFHDAWGWKPHPNDLTHVAANGHLDICKWFKDARFFDTSLLNWTNNAIRGAANHDHLDVCLFICQWALELKQHLDKSNVMQ